MTIKKINKSIIAVAIGVFCSLGTVFAAPNLYDQILVWADIKTEDAKLEVETKISELVHQQLQLLDDQTTDKLLESDMLLKELSRLEIEDTTGTIKNVLEAHTQKLNQKSQEIQAGSGKDFDQVVENINVGTTDKVKTIETDYEEGLGALSHSTLNSPETKGTKGQAAENLEREIQLTMDSINSLKALQSSEPNQAIKDYIQKKIDYLTYMIEIFNSGKYSG
ncbi:hypothetical protein [Bacillus infantis]|uniref:hypothetical protein n=1 Tax=Bacillus infantis TaxID=324767 RepID=UPI003CE90D2F